MLLRHQECLLVFQNRERTRAGVPSALWPRDCKGSSIRTPPFAEGLFVPAGTPLLQLIPWDGFMTSWRRQAREGVGYPSQVPITQVPQHSDTGIPAQHCTFPWVPQHTAPQYTATPAHRYPATQVPQHKVAWYSDTPVHHSAHQNPTHGCT